MISTSQGETEVSLIDPLFPPVEFVCSLTTRLMPPGSETARFGLDTTID